MGYRISRSVGLKNVFFANIQLFQLKKTILKIGIRIDWPNKFDSLKMLSFTLQSFRHIIFSIDLQVSIKI